MKFLTKVLKLTGKRVDFLKKTLSRKAHSKTEKRNFLKAIKREKELKIIAEVKKSSPSKGVIISDYNPQILASQYQAQGADAISVLTEPYFFAGCIEDIKLVKEKVNLPILRKDFIIDEIQILESKLIGADAVLLIARILSKKKLETLYKKAKELDLEVLLEVHNQEDLEKALGVDAKIIGINNRDLDTLKINLKTTQSLIKKIPPDKVVVSESGIKSKEDVVKLKELKIDGLLIGYDLLKNGPQRIKTYKEV